MRVKKMALIHMERMKSASEEDWGKTQNARNPNSHEEEILHGADVDVNTFKFNIVTVFCLQMIDVVHLIQLRDENEPFKN